MTEKEECKSLSDTEVNENEDGEKTVLVAVETKTNVYDKNVRRVKVMLHTQLGESCGVFDATELKQIHYFANQLSGRWKNDAIIISCIDLNFDVTDLIALLICKSQKKISHKYALDRLPYLCFAMDYFAEKINVDVFFKYFSKHIPAIKPKELESLKSLCTALKSRCQTLPKAIEKYSKRMNATRSKISNIVLQNWRNASIKVLTSNNFVAASVFIEYVKIAKRNKKYDIYSISFLQHRSVNDLSMLWEHIKRNKLYLQYPQIITSIEGLHNKKGEYYRYEYYSNSANYITSIDQKTAILLRVLALDVIDIIFTGKGIEVSIKSMINNLFEIIKMQEFEQKCAIHSYDFLLSVILKLLDWRCKNSDLFRKYCKDIEIVKLLFDRFKDISTAMTKRNFFNDINKMNTKFGFVEDERSELLKMLLENYSIQKMKLQCVDIKRFKKIIKGLIEWDCERSFKLTQLWFPWFMHSDKEWIINELPNKCSFDVLEPLLHGICEYISSADYKKSPCQSFYFDFINEYTNYNWEINSS